MRLTRENVSNLFSGTFDFLNQLRPVIGFAALKNAKGLVKTQKKIDSIRLIRDNPCHESRFPVQIYEDMCQKPREPISGGECSILIFENFW